MAVFGVLLVVLVVEVVVAVWVGGGSGYVVLWPRRVLHVIPIALLRQLAE